MAAVTAAVFTVVVFTAAVVTVVVTVAAVMAAVGPTVCNKRCARQPLPAAVVYRRQTACFVVRDCACGLPGLRKLAAVRYVHAR
jgi:hypothetical protein